MAKKDKKSKRSQQDTPPSEGITDSESEAMAVEKRLKKMGSLGSGGTGGAVDDNIGTTTFDGTMGKSNRKTKKNKKKRNSGDGEPFAITSYESGGGTASEVGTPRKRGSGNFSTVGVPQPPVPLTTDDLSISGSLPPLATKQQSSQFNQSNGATRTATATAGSHGPGSAADGAPPPPPGRLPDINRANHFQYLDSLPAPSKGITEGGGAGGGRPCLDL